MYVDYRAPTPVSLWVSHPKGVCAPLLGPTPPTPSASGFAEVKDCFRADAAWWTNQQSMSGANFKRE
jgi:hypothetical protein